MDRFELIAPCHFGMEAVLKKEIRDLGYEILQVDNGKVTFEGDAEAIARVNIFLRTTERILIKVASFHAETFDDLFEGIKALHWEEYLPEDAKFWVAKANSVSSKLFSPSDIQRIVKKAMVERLKSVYHTDWFKEDGASYPLRISIMKDEVTVGLDTTGTSLHKRGYRQFTAPAPVTETLAAALIMLTPWNRDRLLVDPFCGSGTIPIEAAMIAANIAPGMNREFLAEEWKNLIPKKEWYDAITEANDMIIPPEEIKIQGYDIDPEVLKMARKNAELAGVDEYIHFQQRDVKDFSTHNKYGFVISNPPYGERLSTKDEMFSLYHTVGQVMKQADTWSYYFLSGYEDAEKAIGRKATKNRKIYNGMLKTYYYQFMGPKPPRRRPEEKKESQEKKMKKKLVFATGNLGKVKEFKQILGDDYEVLSLKDIDLGDVEIEENGKTFEENSMIKAKAIMELTGEMVLADDSGFEVDYLGKEPGIYSARYLGEDTPYSVKNAEILKRCENAKGDERSARFVCVIACAFPDGRVITTEGVVEGLLADEPKGEYGFGYDPIFFYPPAGCTTGELLPEDKNEISHRGIAIRKMVEKLHEVLGD